VKRIYKIMLVAVSVAWILVTLFSPTCGGTKNRAPKIKAHSTLKDITLGLQNYHIEYKRWPVPGNDEVKTPCAGPLLQILLGNNVDGLNVREIPYIEPPSAKDGVGGLTGSSSAFQLTDPWGHPYVILLDSNGDGKIANPDLKNTDPGISGGAPAQISAKVAAWSLGPDGIEGTKDDVVSWRS